MSRSQLETKYLKTKTKENLNLSIYKQTISENNKTFFFSDKNTNTSEKNLGKRTIMIIFNHVWSLEIYLKMLLNP